MIRIHLTALASAALLVSALTGCAPAQPDVAETLGTPASKPMSCNLGEEYDAATGSVRARYDDPVDPDYYREHYGEWVANETCTDSQVLAWQQLRRDAGESDEICRVAYEYDAIGGIVYPIGCAVPVMVVTDAPR